MIGAFGLILGMTSCLKEGTNKVTRTISAPAITILKSTQDGSVKVSYGFYQFDLTMTETEMTGSVNSPELIANDQSLGFVTSTVDYKSSTQYNAYLSGVTATAGNTGMELTNTQFLALYPYDADYNKYGYYYNTSFAGDYTFNFKNLNPINNWITVARYNIGSSYEAYTFQPDALFRGTTNTSYPYMGEMGRYSTDAISYRVILDLKENKAVMVIYNAKFSNTPEPVKEAIIAEDLDVSFSSTGLTISGTNITPDVVEGEGVTPNDKFVFNNIEFKTTNYKDAEIDFTVAGVYNGHFEGNYYVSYYM